MMAPFIRFVSPRASPNRVTSLLPKRKSCEYMIAPVLSKLAATRKWIFLAAVAWMMVLVLVARSTAKLRARQPGPEGSERGVVAEDLDPQLLKLRRENDRLQNELKKLPELSATVAQLQNISPTNKQSALWAGQSNALQAAIEQKQRELAELHQWSSDWQKAQQLEAAQARLAEKAKESSANPD